MPKWINKAPTSTQMREDALAKSEQAVVPQPISRLLLHAFHVTPSSSPRSRKSAAKMRFNMPKLFPN